MALLLADVSEFQTVNWAAYGAANPAVIVRAHNGWRADRQWAANLAGSRLHCQWRGFYQYLPASVDARLAARAFAATVGGLWPGEVAILDLEEGAGDQRSRRTAWLDELTTVGWTYSGLYFARDHLPGVAVEWVAAYQATEPTKAHLLWQYTNAQPFAGIGACDGNRFNGTLTDLQALTGADMALTDADARKIWGADVIPTTWTATDDATNPTWAATTFFGYVGKWIQDGRVDAQATRTGVATALKTLDAVKVALTAAAVDAKAARVAAEAANAQARANAAGIAATAQAVSVLAANVKTLVDRVGLDAAAIDAGVQSGLGAIISNATTTTTLHATTPGDPT